MQDVSIVSSWQPSDRHRRKKGHTWQLKVKAEKIWLRGEQREGWWTGGRMMSNPRTWKSIMDNMWDLHSKIWKCFISCILSLCLWGFCCERIRCLQRQMDASDMQPLTQTHTFKNTHNGPGLQHSQVATEESQPNTHKHTTLHAHTHVALSG